MLSQRRITISTIGIVPGIKQLTEEYPQVNLAYSLHAPTNQLRETLMPITKTFSLDTVLNTLDDHIRRTNRKVFLAYIMLKDVNDSDDHARQLAELLTKYKKCLPLYHLDLIPYNQTTVAKRLAPSNHKRIRTFCRILHDAGISVNIRTQFGSDINAACGQLAGTYREEPKEKQPQKAQTNKSMDRAYALRTNTKPECCWEKMHFHKADHAHPQRSCVIGFVLKRMKIIQTTRKISEFGYNVNV